MKERNSFGMTKKQVDRKYPDEPTTWAIKAVNKHIHWRGKRGLCKICGKLVPIMDEE